MPRAVSAYASRRVPNPAYLPEVLAGIASVNPYRWPLERAQCFEKVRDYWGRADIEALTTGLEHNDARWRRAVTEAIARCESRDDVLLDVDPEAASVALAMSPVFSAMPYWLCAAGPVVALRAMITCSGIRSHARAYGYGSAGTWVLEQVDAASDEPEYCATAWSLLRGTLATVDDATYAAAREVASAARGLSVWRDAWLAFVFPDEDWAASLVEPLLERAQTMGRTYSPMFARFVSVAPTAAARTLVTTLANKALVAADLVTLVAHRGPGAHEVLEAALAAATNKDGRTLVAHAMAAVGLKEPTAKRGPATKKRS